MLAYFASVAIKLRLFCGSTNQRNFSSNHRTDITVRLRGGTSANNGRVEVLYNDTWGTICDNDWDIQDAQVVCRMVGFEGAWSTQCCGFYGYGSGEIWMDSVQCSGSESSLAECAHSGWGNHYDVCSHYSDVGVYCIPSPITIPGMKKCKFLF